MRGTTTAPFQRPNNRKEGPLPGGRGAGLRRDLVRRALFLRSMLAHPRAVGAVWPTSRWAVRDLLDMADLRRAGLVVEFGVGTGVYTRGILDRLRQDARLLAFEVDGEMAAAVRDSLPDPRLRVLNESAENVERHVGEGGADAIVSSLPFSTLPRETREDILAASGRALAPGGSLLVLQYSTAVLPALRRHFGRVRRRFSPLNVPPAMLFACEEPKAAQG